jgi:hypothetical protein
MFYSTDGIKIDDYRNSKLTFCMLGGVPDAGEVAEDPLDIEELESLPLPPCKEI